MRRPPFLRYLNKYPPEHYSKAGREPLLYATVLLLSLQFAAALRRARARF